MPAIDIRPCTEADLPAVVDLLLANMPYTPTPSRNASPLLPTSAKAVIVVPNMLINSRKGPML